MFTDPLLSFQLKLHSLSSVSVDFTAPREFWNSMSKAVPGEFHRSGRYNKCKKLTRPSQFSQVLGIANCWNYQHCINSHSRYWLCRMNGSLFFIRGWVELYVFLWWAPLIKKKVHQWVSFWVRLKAGLSRTQYEQFSVIFEVWPFQLTVFESITFG